MRTSRRVLLSLACVIVALQLICFRSLFGLVGTNAQQLYELKRTAEIMPVYFLFALPGWLIALPFVILFKDAEDWRGWAILLIGTAIGPGFILAWGLLESHGHFRWTPGDALGLGVALIISLLTTVCYLLTLKLAHRRSIAEAR